ncbi:hypothetical protein D3C78_1730540 [compost metagenome]
MRMWINSARKYIESLCIYYFRFRIGQPDTDNGDLFPFYQHIGDIHIGSCYNRSAFNQLFHAYTTSFLFSNPLPSFSSASAFWR